MQILMSESTILIKQLNKHDHYSKWCRNIFFFFKISIQKIFVTPFKTVKKLYVSISKSLPNNCVCLSDIFFHITIKLWHVINDNRIALIGLDFPNYPVILLMLFLCWRDLVTSSFNPRTITLYETRDNKEAGRANNPLIFLKLIFDFFYLKMLVDFLKIIIKWFEPLLNKIGGNIR